MGVCFTIAESYKLMTCSNIASQADSTRVSLIYTGQSAYDPPANLHLTEFSEFDIRKESKVFKAPHLTLVLVSFTFDTLKSRGYPDRMKMFKSHQDDESAMKMGYTNICLAIPLLQTSVCSCLFMFQH